MTPTPFSVVAAALAALLFSGAVAAADLHSAEVAARKVRFLADRVDEWAEAGYPLVQHEGLEWKFNEIEPCWAGAHAALLLKRNEAEVTRANWFFENAPVDWDTDPDMRMCELLHSWYAFHDDPDLSAEADANLRRLLSTREAPRRVFRSSWSFRSTENHAMMGHVWRLLTAQMADDTAEVEALTAHISHFIVDHARKGWQEFYSPCYVEKEVGCMVLLREWAEDERLRRLADMMLDRLFAEQAVLTLDGVMAGPAHRAYGREPIGAEGEINHNNRRDRMRSGQYSWAPIVFGTGDPHFYGVLGAMCLASSEYVPPQIISRLGLAGPVRGEYELRARKPGHGLQPWRNSDSGAPPPEAFNARVYCYVTPDYVLGTSQEVPGRYMVTDVPHVALLASLVVKGSGRKTIYFESEGGKPVHLFQHQNVLVGQTGVGLAYVAGRELGTRSEEGGWVFLEDEHAFIALRPARGGWQWEAVPAPDGFGDFLRFEDPSSPFVLEVARPTDYAGDFHAFRRDILDNEVRQTEGDGLVYESCDEGRSGPASRRFAVALRPGSPPMVDDVEVDLEGYPTLETPYVKSAWDSGVLSVGLGGEMLTLDFTDVSRRAVASAELAGTADN